MKVKYVIILAIVFLLATGVLPTSTLSQTTTTGTVEGTITDPNGAVVPNASVSLSGPNLVRGQTTVTGSGRLVPLRLSAAGTLHARRRCRIGF